MALHAQPSLAHLAMRRGLGGSPALIHVKLAPRTELYSKHTSAVHDTLIYTTTSNYILSRHGCGDVESGNSWHDPMILID